MQHLTSYLQPLGALSLYLAIVTVYFADISIAQESSEKDEPKGSWYSYTPAPTVPADCLDGSYNTGICTTANNNERCSYDEGDCCECTCNDMTASGEGECAREFPSEECLDPDAPDAPCPTETPTTYPVTPIPSGTPVSTPTPRALQTEPPMPATAPSAPSPTRDIEVTPSPTSSSRVPPSTAPPPPGNNYDCPFPSGYGDGFCHVSNNNDSCDYDGGDCCECSCIVGEEFICGEASGYDCQDPSCLNDGKTDLAAIIGGVAGGLAGVAIITAGLCCWARRRQLEKTPSAPFNNRPSDPPEVGFPAAAPSPRAIQNPGVIAETATKAPPFAGTPMQYPAHA